MCSRGKVDVGQSVEFVDYDVDVVASDTCGEYGDALAFVCTGYRVKLTASDIALDALEV